MLVSEVTGDVPKIIGNEENLYEGDLTEYFRVLFFKSSNLYNPYHNFRHMLHGLWLCHKACGYYQNRLIPRQMRNLLITAYSTISIIQAILIQAWTIRIE